MLTLTLKILKRRPLLEKGVFKNLGIYIRVNTAFRIYLREASWLRPLISFTFFPKSAANSPKAGSPRRRGLDKYLTTTCVTSVAELTDLVSQAQQRFSGMYQSKDNKFISQVDWTSKAFHTLCYFMKCSHKDEDISDILAATRRYHELFLRFRMFLHAFFCLFCCHFNFFPLTELWLLDQVI